MEKKSYESPEFGFQEMKLMSEWQKNAGVMVMHGWIMMLIRIRHQKIIIFHRVDVLAMMIKIDLIALYRNIRF